MASTVVPLTDEPCEAGKHKFSVNKTVFEIDTRYEPIRAVGKGAYGVVCSAKDTVTGRKVAIKKITNAFDNVTDARRTLREIRLLRSLKHENIIALCDVMAPAAYESFTEVYLVYELMDTDLHQIIRSPQALSDEHFQYFMYQVLRGLKYIHSANVLHRDLKPSNILLNANCDLKICDFGLARTRLKGEAQEETNTYMTEYVVTRWYRAPELLLSCDSYGEAIDVWAAGCILAELLGRRALFPGRDYMDQLKLIVRTLGNPEEAALQHISSSRARQFIKSLPVVEPKPWKEVYPAANPLALQLLDAMLQFDPARRISVENALAHPYLAALHDVATEPSAAEEVQIDIEGEDVEESMLRHLFWQEVRHYHPDLPAQPGL